MNQNEIVKVEKALDRLARSYRRSAAARFRRLSGRRKARQTESRRQSPKVELWEFWRRGEPCPYCVVANGTTIVKLHEC